MKTLEDSLKRHLYAKDLLIFSSGMDPLPPDVSDGKMSIKFRRPGKKSLKRGEATEKAEEGELENVSKKFVPTFICPSQ